MNGVAKFKSTWFVVPIPVGRTANDTLVEAKTAGDLCAVRAHVAARHKETA